MASGDKADARPSETSSYPAKGKAGTAYIRVAMLILIQDSDTVPQAHHQRLHYVNFTNALHP